jgi:hypothetical protein
MSGEVSDEDVDRYRKLRRQLNSSPSARSDEISARLRSGEHRDA